MELIDGKYQLSGGINPLELGEKYGYPLYVYDTAIIERKYQALMNAFHVPLLRLHYACKANTNINILRFFKSLGTGIDAVSIQEVWLAKKAGFTPGDIIYTPNCVSMEEIDLAVKEGVRINIDNISILEQFGQKYPHIPVGIRLNPHVMGGGHEKISTGHIDSKFGISIHQLPHVLRVVEATGLTIEGLHQHTGSDILDVGVFLQSIEILLQYAPRFPQLKYINFGSGFKVAYKRDDIETDVEEFGQRISEYFNTFCNEYGRDLDLYFEPGKYLVSEAGYFFCKVNVIKQTTSTVFVGIDSGLNHLIRPMLYDAYHRIENVSYPLGKHRIYTVVGYICETDTFGVNMRIPEIMEGEIVAIYNAGAYCYSMSSNYNSRFRPAEVMILNGKDYLIRKRENLDDLLHNQIEVSQQDFA